MIKLQAHRGVSTEAPENTLEALRTAVEQGYFSAEIDISVTRDGQFVLLHDKKINRTARTRDGESLKDGVCISDVSYEQALDYDFGVWFHKKYEGAEIPFFADVLDFAEKSGLKLKIDNKYESFSEDDKEGLFKLLAPYQRTASLTCKNLGELRRAAAALPKMSFHYDGAVDGGVLCRLSEILPKERLTVWVPLRNRHTEWARLNFATPELCAEIKEYARLGIWLLSEYSELAEAEALGADIAETNGSLKPVMNEGVLADMHTHSNHSHDSSLDMETSRGAQAEAGTAFAAFTDHSDIGFYKTREAFNNIAESVDEVARLNARNDSKCRLLCGVEVGDGIYYPAQMRRVEGMRDYDVIIGSMHCFSRLGELRAYSSYDFSSYTDTDTDRFMRSYFADVQKMIEVGNFDILAHLTCPLRYISGRYGKSVDMTRYADEIDTILSEIIKKGIALELNTSSLSLKLGDFVPDTEILKRYRVMGGYLITLGSDAHIASEVSANFGRAVKHLKSLGFENIFYYRKRRAYQCKI